LVGEWFNWELFLENRGFFLRAGARELQKLLFCVVFCIVVFSGEGGLSRRFFPLKRVLYALTGRYDLMS